MECRQGTSSSVGKGSGTIVQYIGSIFPAFDELYLLIIPVFNTAGNVLCTFPVKNPPDCKISLYLQSPIFAINIDIGAE